MQFCYPLNYSSFLKLVISGDGWSDDSRPGPHPCHAPKIDQEGGKMFLEYMLKNTSPTNLMIPLKVEGRPGPEF